MPNREDITHELYWDGDELVVMEHRAGGGTAERFRSRIGVPSSPLIITHESSRLLLQKILQSIASSFKEGGKPSFLLRLSPPWAVSWNLENPGLPENELDEHVLWELEQRVDSDIAGYLTTWRQNEDGTVVALSMNARFVPFWLELMEDADCKLGGIVLKSETEEVVSGEEVDFLALYEIRGDTGGETTPGETASSADSETEEKQPYEQYDLNRDYRDHRKKYAIIGVAAILLVIIVTGWYFRSSIQGIFTANSSRDASPDTRLTEGVAEIPTMESAPSFIKSIFQTADSNRVKIRGVILQGDWMLCELSGADSALGLWGAQLKERSVIRSMELTAPMEGGAGSLVSCNIFPDSASTLTEKEIDNLFSELHFSGEPSLPRVSRQELNTLLDTLTSRKIRPYRLSIHSKPNHTYALFALP